jgi:hypothetical protein
MNSYMKMKGTEKVDLHGLRGQPLRLRARLGKSVVKSLDVVSACWEGQGDRYVLV